MVVMYDHTVQEHHFFSSGTLMASTCDLKGTKIGETAQCGTGTDYSIDHTYYLSFPADGRFGSIGRVL